MRKLLCTLVLITAIGLTSCNGNSATTLTGDVYEVGTSSFNGITFFAMESNNEKVGFFLDEYYENDTLILSQVKVEYDATTKSNVLDSNMEEIVTYTADNITVLEVYDSNWS